MIKREMGRKGIAKALWIIDLIDQNDTWRFFLATTGRLLCVNIRRFFK